MPGATPIPPHRVTRAEVVLDTLGLPQVDDLGEVFAGARACAARIERLVREVFAVYERAAPFIENVRRERADLPTLEHWHGFIEGALDALTSEALKPARPDDDTHRVVRALLDLSTWTAFRTRGFTAEETVEAVSELIRRFMR
jgi:hypothetical protein